MSDLGNETIARLFRELQDFEQRHVAALTAKARDMDLPAIAPGQHAWLDSGAPVPEARAFVFRAMTPRMALDIALVAEVRARAFFESVHAATGDRGIRALAREFAEEEQTHIQTVRYAIDRLPEPYRDSEERPGHPATPLEL
jgi:rubrerythrin